MFDVHDSLPTCHDLEDKYRTSDVLFGEKVTFSSLLLKEEIQKGLTKCGYMYLSPIQKNALPPALTGASIIAHAKSGTGKTLVYCLSVLNNVLEKKQQNLQCVILSPTREIAKQIYDVFKNVGYYIEDLRVEYFIGGTPLDLDVLKCKGCQIAIGAPGRMKHLIEMGELKVNHVEMLVLDEVDALLSNKEFAIRELSSYLPSEKQTIVCTATFSDNIKQLLNPISSTIKYITVNESMDDENKDQITSNVLIGIKQFVAPVFSDSTSLDAIRKRNKLIAILRDFKYDQCFVFVNYVTIAKGLCNMLVSNNFPALWVSSEQNQSTRISTLNKLKLNQCNILVTTDLAARGIDVHNVNLVINMGIPSPPDVYIHRMGRAGRYGSEGAVITILHEGNETEQFYKLVSSVSTDPVDLFILPNEFSKNINESELQKVHCKPDSNALPNGNEYQFRKNNENQTKTAIKKKSKKSKKKKKLKNDEYLPETLESNSFAEDDDYAEGIIQNVAVDKEMESIIEHYVEAIKEEVHREGVSIDERNLRNLFKHPEHNFYVVHYTNFFKPTFIDIPDVTKDDDDDDDVFIQTIDDTCLIRFMDLIRKKHTFLDEQKLPCSMAQFLKLVNCNETLIHKLVSVDVQDSVKNILAKIRSMLVENEQKQCIPARLITSENLEGIISRNSSTLIHQQMKFKRPQSLDTVNSIECETSNWMVSRTDYLCRQYLPKCDESLDNSTPSVKNFTADPPNFHSNTPYTVFRSSRNDLGVQRIGLRDGEECYQYSTRLKPRTVPLNTSCRTNLNNVPNRNSHPECVTCPNCQHVFSLPRRNNSPFLCPIKFNIDKITERMMWQNHFKFINSQVSSRPFTFGNR